MLSVSFRSVRRNPSTIVLRAGRIRSVAESLVATFTAGQSTVAMTALVARGTAIVAQVLTMPLLITALGTSKYATLMVVASYAPWVGLVDSSVGGALQNELAQREVSRQPTEPLIAAALAISLCLAAIGTCIAVFFHSALLTLALGPMAESLSPGENRHLGYVLAAILLSRIVTVAYRVYFARRYGHWLYLHQALAAISSMAGVWYLAPALRRANGMAIAGALLFLPAAILGGWAWFQVLRTFEGRLAWDAAAFRCIGRLSLRMGSFFGLGIFVTSIDYFIMARTLSAADIATYAVLSRLFSGVFAVYASLQMASWPVMAEQCAKAEWDKCRVTIGRLIRAGWWMVGAAAAVVAFGGTRIIELLSGGRLTFLGTSTVALCAGYYALRVWTDSYSTAVLSNNHFRVFLWFVPVQALLCASLEWTLSRQVGLSGVYLGLCLASLATAVPVLPKTFRRLERLRQAFAPAS
jgi:O-antigen/teichoic acid export membrane protein